MNAAQPAPYRRHPLYAKTCAVLACLVALMMLLFVSERMRVDGDVAYREAASSLRESARLWQLATDTARSSPEAAASARMRADLLVRNDTLLADWRQRGAPSPALDSLLKALPDAARCPGGRLDAVTATDALRAEDRT